MKLTIKWKANAGKKFSQVMNNRLAMAGLLLRNEHRKNINRPYPPASTPGEFPARRTGNLRDGTLLEVEPNKATVSYNVFYWVFLHRSGRLMLGETFRAMKNRLVKMLLEGN